MSFIDAAISTTFLGNVGAATAPPGTRRHAIVATWRKGPAYPMDLPASQVEAFYGAHSEQASAGYTGPGMIYFGNQQDPPGGSGINYVVCRAGVVSAGVHLVDSSGADGIAINGIGVYAGTAGRALRVSVLNPSGTQIQKVIITDNSSGATVLQLTDPSIAGGTYPMSSNADVVNYINALNPVGSIGSTVTASLFSNTNLIADTTNTIYTTHGAGVGPQPLSGGGDGLGTTPGSGDPNGTIPALLAALLQLPVPVDFISMGWDAASVQGAALTAINNALAQNGYRKVYLGPKKATLYSSLSSGSYFTGQSSRFYVDGHDSLAAINPATGALYPYDGFYYASAIATRKAMLPPKETLFGDQVDGFLYINPPLDQPAGLNPAQLNALESAGLGVSTTSPYQPGVRIKELITTLPQVSANTSQENLFFEAHLQDIDDAVAKKTYGAALPFFGDPYAPDLVPKIKDEVRGAVQSLGSTINGINSIDVTFSPNLDQMTVAVNYITRQEIRSISITIGSTTS